MEPVPSRSGCRAGLWRAGKGEDSMATTQRENKALVEQFLTDVVAGGELDALDTFVTEDVVDHNAVFGEHQGIEASRKAGKRVIDAFADFDVTIEELIAEDDTVAVRATVSGTHARPILDLEPTGESFEIAYMWFYRIEDGQIAELWSLPDGLGLLQQLKESVENP